ncbi:MAG: glycosyltransferase [Lachnospiraceae bacterium]|nr:glycosyltransferase [Lachnospiraceae bacterium]
MKPSCDLLHTKILYVDWNCYGGQDMKSALHRAGATLSLYPFSPRTDRTDAAFEIDFTNAIRSFSPQYVFSFNYFPIISKVCNMLETTYVSWVYDSPLVALYSYTLANPCNRVFLFDKQEYLFFKNNGIPTVDYLPLAAAPGRLPSDAASPNAVQKYRADISFVGSLYTEPKHQLHHRIRNLPDFTRGYLDGIMQAQKQIYGASLIEELLNEDVLSELRKACPCPPHQDGVETERYLYSNYFLLRQVTAMERTELIQKISRQYALQLYTNDKTFTCPGCTNHGPADYYQEAPYIFFHSKINLNITLRSIKSGIPLRAFDIMGSRGFLLTNYQDDFLDCFIPDEDYVYYTNTEDLLSKIEYYLSHEKERLEICRNGYEKILSHHTYDCRIPVLFGDLSGK